MKRAQYLCILLLIVCLTWNTGCENDPYCPKDLSWCWAKCVDLKNDGDNCGWCDNKCVTDSTCKDGKCTCTPGYTFCSSECVDLMVNEDNCGACGAECETGFSCCGGLCVDTLTDVENCGVCARSCAADTQGCDSGTCVNKDKDGDGYTGEEWGGEDCDDQDPNVNPGAPEICGPKDDDCDGQVDEDPEATASCDDNDLCTDEVCIRGQECFYIFMDCNDEDDCTVDICVNGRCVYDPIDADGDGHSPPYCGLDCDDTDPNVNPDSIEGPPGSPTCNDLIDNDCDGNTDTILPADTGCCLCSDDADCDDSNACTTDICSDCVECRNNPLTDGTPCDDGDGCTINDQCENGVCIGDPSDDDCDGYGSDQCGGDDCDDASRLINPGMTEDSQVRFVCSDGIDNDCDGLTDHDEAGCCVPVCAGMECGDGGCPDQPVACGTCLEGYWCNTGVCEEITSELVWIYIPGGTFMMGSELGHPDEVPVHVVNVPSFYMTMTEVTVSQYTACMDAGWCLEPEWPCNWWGQPGMDDYPIACITWYESADFCAWAGGRLPTEAEWEYAARSGGQEITYPWGEEMPSCQYAVCDSGCYEGVCCPSGCEDGDQDGYGKGSGCLGLDCNDSDSNCHIGDCCLDCIDVDGDGYGDGQSCLGHDCDDSDPSRWLDDCGPCAGRDGDSYGRGFNCLGPDCNDGDRDCHEGSCCTCCIDIDGDGYGVGAGCLGNDCTEDFYWAHENYGCWRDSPWPVCSKPSGNTDQSLCDMAGNVWEWLQDYYHSDYTGAPSDGSAWEDPPAVRRVLRGCGFSCPWMSLRVSNRARNDTSSSLRNNGFRCARDQ